MDARDRADATAGTQTAAGGAPGSPEGVRPRRLVVLSLLNQPPERVVDYLRHLVSRGDQVDLLVAKPQLWREVEFPGPLRIHAPDQPEERGLVRRVERLVVYRGPGAVTAAARRIADTSAGRPIRRPTQALDRAQKRVSGAVHQRLFMPTYRALRPLLLSRQFRQAIREIDFSRVDLIVASDVYSVTLGAKLARRYPSIPVTTGMEL